MAKKTKIKKYNINVKEGLAISLIYILLIPLVVTIVYDHLLYGTLEGTIELLSVDSVLALISVIAPIIFTFFNSRTNSEYKLKSEDHKQLKIISNGFYINLLVVSIALIFLDIFFYIYNFRISIATSIGIETLYVLIFVVPISISLAQERKHFFRLARTRMTSLKIKTNSDKKIYEFLLNDCDKTNSPNSVLNKFTNNLLLKEGVENTINSLSSGWMIKYSQDYLPTKSDVFVYVVYLQDYYLKKLLNGETDDVELNEIVIDQYIKNLSIICSSPILSYISDLDKDVKDDVLCKLVTSFGNLQKIVEQSESSTLLTNDFYRIINNLLVTSFAVSDEEKEQLPKDAFNGLDDLDSFCFSLVNSIFFYSLLNDYSPWFLKALSYTNNESIFVLSKTEFYLYMLFVLLFTINTITNNADDINEVDCENIKATLRERFSNYLRDFLDNTNVGLYVSLNNFNDKITKSLKNFSLYSDYSFYKLYEETNRSNEYITLLHFLDRRNSFDSFIRYNEKGCEDIFKSAILLSDSESSKIRNFHSTLVDLGICNEDKEFNQKMEKLFNYISKYNNRKLTLEKITKKLATKQFVNKMNESFSKMDGFVFKNEKTQPIPAAITFLVKNNKKMNITNDDTFCNPNHVVRRIFSTEKNPYGHINRISGFSKDILNEIKQFNPTSKFAPKFDDYFKNSSDPDIQNLLNLRTDYEFLFPDGRYEIFFKSDPVQFYIQLKDIDNIRLILPEDLKEPYINSYKKSYNHVLDKLNLTAKGNDSEIFKSIAQKYVLVTISFEYSIISYPDENRLVYELCDEQDLNEYVDSLVGEI